MISSYDIGINGANVITTIARKIIAAMMNFLNLAFVECSMESDAILVCIITYTNLD